MFLRTLLHCALGGALAVASMVLAADAAKRITILYDAFSTSADFTKDWGFSAYIEYRGKRILFDTGNDAQIFAHNVKAAGGNLAELDFVVISHRHLDHTAGLSYLLSVNPHVRIYAPKESFGVFGSSLPSSFYRKDESLPSQMRYYDGVPPETMTFGSAWPAAKFEMIDKTFEVAPGVHVLSLVSDKPGTRELRELSLAIETPEGMVVIAGCSHPGVDQIVEAAAAIDSRVALVMGDFICQRHPMRRSRASPVRSRIHARSIGSRQGTARENQPSHCSGRCGANVTFMPGSGASSSYRNDRHS